MTEILQRVQKLIAESGICSRRKAEDLIIQGRVSVNGRKIKIGDQASKDDHIEVDGRRISFQTKMYYLLNKPKEIMVTKDDPEGRMTIYDLPSVKKLPPVFSVGRLDLMSEGMLLLTNDGEWANKLTHPRYEVEKTYYLRVEPEFKDAKRLEHGVSVEGIMVRPRVMIVSKTELEITIHEGRKRIIRKLMEQLGYKIYCLRRIKIGKLTLGGLKLGEVRILKGDEI